MGESRQCISPGRGSHTSGFIYMHVLCISSTFSTNKVNMMFMLYERFAGIAIRPKPRWVSLCGSVAPFLVQLCCSLDGSC